MRSGFLAVWLALATLEGAGAQERARVGEGVISAAALDTLAQLASLAAQLPDEPPFAVSLLVESVGGAAGSGLGFLAGAVLAGSCEGEDIQCFLAGAGTAIAAATAGSALGAWGAGMLGGTRPSGWGAAVGALLGAAGGVGMAHLLSEDLDVIRGDFAVGFSYALTQGLAVALGSRIGAALR